MNKDLIAIFEYLEREKGIKRDLVISAIEESLQVAARKSISGASNVTVSIHPKTANIEVYCEKEIVEEVEVGSQEISLSDARLIDPEAELEQFIDVLVTPKDFGRIAAQKARQIISQKLRSAERDVIYAEYRNRVNELLSGTVKRIARGSNLIIDLGQVEAIMPAYEFPKTERYKIGEKVLAVLLEVKDTENGGAAVILSRSHPEFVRQLFTQEVAEIKDGIVVIEKIVREPGYRTKLTVRSRDSKVDPVGACVGMRGHRIKLIQAEIRNEKIDIIPHSDDPIEQLQNALSPIEIRKINLNEDEKLISIIVDDEDFPIVIGKKRANLRLNEFLIGYQLDAQCMSDYHKSMAIQQNQLADSDDPSLDQPLPKIEGMNSLVFAHISDILATEGYDTIKKLLKTTPEQLAAIPGIGIELADKILEQIRQQRI